MRYLLALTGMVILFAISASAGFAGEVTGNGKYIAGSDAAPLHGKSPCAYSGLNDNYVFGRTLPDADGFTQTQNWGQIIRQADSPNAGNGGAGPAGCNPNLGSSD